MKRRSGINMSDVKMSNRGLILSQIRTNPKPRKNIADKIKLTPAAVTILVNELIEQGCIRESGQVSEPTRVGRKKVYIELDKNYKYAFGINIEGSHINVCLGNLKAEIIEYTNDNIQGLSPEEVLGIAVDNINELIARQKLNKEQILGIGVGIVGYVDTERGLSKHAYGLWDVEVDIESYLFEALDLPVVVENNVRALALAEMELTIHHKNRNMVFMKLGPGIGSAIILDNDIYKGSYNNAGELGHMVIDLEGKKCRCGQVGCLETVASIAVLLEEIKAGFTKVDYPILYDLVEGDSDRLTEEHIIDAYLEGDSLVIEHVDKLICFISISVINSINFYDPNKIVIFSKMFQEPIFMEKLVQVVLQRGNNEDIEDRIEPSRLDTQKGVGGLVLVVNELFFKIGATVSN